MLEKRFRAVSPQAFVANGTANGVITIVNATLFKVKQEVLVEATGLPQLELEVKDIQNITTMIVGPRGGNIRGTINISAYTTGLGANVFANEQKRPPIDYAEIMRGVFEEEPAVALRNLLVDKLGSPYDSTNPLPVDATVSVVVPPVAVDLDAITPPTRPDPDNVLIVGSTDGTKGGLKAPIRVDADGIMQTVSLGKLVIRPFDYIDPTYPSPTQEVYTYKLGGAGGTITTIVTVNYTDATKAVLGPIYKVEP